MADPETVDREVDLFEADRHLDARDRLRHMQEGLAKLSPRVREILQLRKIDGLNVKETAARLGIGSDAVRQQTVLGMRALTDHMAGGRGKIIWPQFKRRRDSGGGS